MWKKMRSLGHPDGRLCTPVVSISRPHLHSLRIPIRHSVGPRTSSQPCRGSHHSARNWKLETLFPTEDPRPFWPSFPLDSDPLPWSSSGISATYSSQGIDQLLALPLRTTTRTFIGYHGSPARITTMATSTAACGGLHSLYQVRCCHINNDVHCSRVMPLQ